MGILKTAQALGPDWAEGLGLDLPTRARLAGLFSLAAGAAVARDLGRAA